MTDQAQEARITVEQNGPYFVEGTVTTKNADGEVVSRERAGYLLCRCGGSSRKPFCDSTHEKNGFDGTEVANRDAKSERQDTYEGEGITVYDDRSICAHIGNCSDNLAAVFKLPPNEPWVDASAATAEAIARVVATCPSGALGYALGASPEPVEADREPGITASKGGPYFVVGRIPVQSPDGSTYEVRARMALCRCGGSGNKPFCDGTHWSNGFQG